MAEISVKQAHAQTSQNGPVVFQPLRLITSEIMTMFPIYLREAALLCLKE